MSSCSPKTSTELNHEELMKVDFSSIVGEYVNPNDVSTTLNEDGLREGEIIGGDIG